MIDHDIDEAARKIALHCGRADAVLDDYRAVAKAYAARLAEAEATASTANHGHELCYEKLLSAEARLADVRKEHAEALDGLRETQARLAELEKRAIAVCEVCSGGVIDDLRAFLRPTDSAPAVRCSANDDGHQCIKPAGHGGSHVV